MNESDYKACVELYDGSMCIYARVAKDDYYGPIRYDDDELNADVQEAFDKLGFQVVLNAMIHYGMESTVLEDLLNDFCTTPLPGTCTGRPGKL